VNSFYRRLGDTFCQNRFKLKMIMWCVSMISDMVSQCWCKTSRWTLYWQR